MTRPVALPLLLTLLLHALVAALLLVHFEFKPPERELKPQPRIVQAKLVSMESNPVQRTAKQAPKPQPPAPPPAPRPQPEPAPKPAPQPKPEPEKAAPSKADLEKQRQLEQQKKLEAEKKLEEQKRKEAEARKRAEDEARKKEEARRQAESERKRQQELLQQEMARAMAAEEEAFAAETEGQLVASYMDVIQSAIERAWSRPPSARTGMRVELAISMIPTCEVVDVAVSKSSGNDAFDRSAIAAVKRVGSFPELRDLDRGRLCASALRRFNLDFYPEDLRL